jgi:membrane-bound ClpP family serine protease
MQWINWACLVLIVTGILLLVIGANVYNPIIGYTGVTLGAGGIVAYLVWRIYSELTKK